MLNIFAISVKYFVMGGKPTLLQTLISGQPVRFADVSICGLVFLSLCVERKSIIRDWSINYTIRDMVLCLFIVQL